MREIGSDGAVVGVYGHAGAPRLALTGVSALSHRGRRAAMIAGRADRIQRVLFRLEEGTRPPDDLDGASRLAIATAASRRSAEGRSTEPVVAQTLNGLIGVATSGRLVNAPSLERDLLADGAVLHRSSDAELLLHLIARSGQRTLINRVVDALSQARGGFAVLLASEGTLVAVRDPLGIRPLVIGRRGPAALVATESRAIARMGGVEVREVEPGEMVILDRDGLTSLYPFPRQEPRPCLREAVAIASHDSLNQGTSGFEVRRAIGERLAAASPAGADLVTALAQWSAPAAVGFAQRSGLPSLPQLLDLGRELGDGDRRETTVTIVDPMVRGQRVVLVHDSVGPEVPWAPILRALRGAGAREVHVRVAAPPTRFPCIYGVALMPPLSPGGGDRPADELASAVDADSVGWLELGPLREAVQSPADNACDGCYSGRYPLVHEDLEQPQLPLFEG